MLIENVDDLKAWARLEFNFKLKEATPWIEQAERDYLRPVLGTAFYNELVAHYEGSASGATMDEVLRLSQRAVALITAHYLGDVLGLQMSDGGIHVTASETHKSPYQWQVGNWKQRYMGAGMNALEDLLEYLELHQDELDNWVAGEGFSEYNACLLRTAREFSAEYAINGSRITYTDLKGALKTATKLYIVPEIGQAFYDELLARLKDEDSASGDLVKDARDEAIEVLRPALAHLAIAEAKEITWRRVNGALVSSRFEGDAQQMVAGDASDADILRRNALATGLKLLAVAHARLDALAGDLPTYANGPGYRSAGIEEIPVTDRLHNSGGAIMM